MSGSATPSNLVKLVTHPVDPNAATADFSQ